MTITTTPVVEDGCLMVGDKVVLNNVPDNVAVSPVNEGSAFLGASSCVQSSRHVFSLGTLLGYKFLSLFRFKIWWMIPCVGKMGSEVPYETQMLLLEVREESVPDDDSSYEATGDNTFYILFLPTLDGQFRSSLQGNAANELEFCIESGDANAQTSQSLEAVFINSGDNPFDLIKNSVKILEKCKGTFCHLENKKIPAHLDWFGWCTWDAFYTDVNPQGIREGLHSFYEGGCTPRFLIIDDGWQQTVNEFPDIKDAYFATRLIDIKENNKFRSSDTKNKCMDLHKFVNEIKEKYGLKYVYVWHALAGYWGGVLPTSETMKKYNPKVQYPIQSSGNVANLRDVAMDSLEKYGVGIIDPGKIYDFFNDLHSYLASSCVDGVKVDVQNVIETLGNGQGGRISLMRQYQEALEQSVARNFKQNNLICCMSHNTDCIYSSKKSATARASEDFMPREPTLQTLHIAALSFNSLLLGEIVVPDWDMFHSKHNTAEFHAAARAVGGCAVYVSDKPGSHDFQVLRKLVLPDGSVLRAKYAGRPTRDCLFIDPVMDGKSLLKIWNLNKCTGVLAVFNCQGAGNWPLRKDNPDKHEAIRISSQLSPLDIEFLEDVAGESWDGDCVLYAFRNGQLSKLQKNGKLEVSLNTLECEIYTVSPVRMLDQNLRFAPIGLLDMYNSGGAVDAVNCSTDISRFAVTVKGRGSGQFGVYSSSKPKRCIVDKKVEEFVYNDKDGLLIVKLEGECSSRNIEFVY